jgi:hypothetical protein
MNSPKMASAIVAASAMMAMGGGFPNAVEYQPGPSGNGMIYDPSITTMRRKGRVAQNQRQRRKDRRRSFAAGNRKAFA